MAMTFCTPQALASIMGYEAPKRLCKVWVNGGYCPFHAAKDASVPDCGGFHDREVREANLLKKKVASGWRAPQGPRGPGSVTSQSTNKSGSNQWAKKVKVGHQYYTLPADEVPEGEDPKKLYELRVPKGNFHHSYHLPATQGNLKRTIEDPPSSDTYVRISNTHGASKGEKVRISNVNKTLLAPKSAGKQVQSEAQHSINNPSAQVSTKDTVATTPKKKRKGSNPPPALASTKDAPSVTTPKKLGVGNQASSPVPAKPVTATTLKITTLRITAPKKHGKGNKASSPVALKPTSSTTTKKALKGNKAYTPVSPAPSTSRANQKGTNPTSVSPQVPTSAIQKIEETDKPSSPVSTTSDSEGRPAWDIYPHWDPGTALRSISDSSSYKGSSEQQSNPSARCTSIESSVSQGTISKDLVKGKMPSGNSKKNASYAKAASFGTTQASNLPVAPREVPAQASWECLDLYAIWLKEVFASSPEKQAKYLKNRDLAKVERDTSKVKLQHKKDIGKIFHHFSDLPGELRNQIWKMARQEANFQTVRLRLNTDGDDRSGRPIKPRFNCTTGSPALTRVSRESRSLFIGPYDYIYAFATEANPTSSILFNPAEDEVFLHTRNYEELKIVSHEMRKEDRVKIQRLAVAFRDYTFHKEAFPMTMAKCFHHLTHLQLVIGDHDQHEKYLHTDKHIKFVQETIAKIQQQKRRAIQQLRPVVGPDGKVIIGDDGIPKTEYRNAYCLPRVEMAIIDPHEALQLGIDNLFW